MSQFEELKSTAERETPGFYKKNLPVEFVLHTEGVSVEQNGDRLSAVCPFHDDQDPSLDMYLSPAKEWRWNCYPCGRGEGDVFDLIGRITGEDRFPAQMIEAKRLYKQMEDEGWESSPVASRASFWNEEVETAKVQIAQTGDTEVIDRFLHDKEIPVTTESLREVWRVGVDGDKIVIPYYDREGHLVAHKSRTARTKAIAAPGSRLRDVLYGEWRDTDESLPVILCEGESDTWAAQQAVGPKFVCLGLSAGSASTPKANGLAGRQVFLAFDGDAAGRQGTARWLKALQDEDCDVSLIQVPEGRDLCTVPDLPLLLSQSRKLLPPPEGLREHGDTYVRPGKDTNTMLTNWRFEPKLELRDSEGMTAYEGVLRPSGQRVTLSSHDLSSKARIVSWCSKYGVSFFGSDRDGQMILALMQSKGPFLSSGTLVSTAGLHGTSFIWPGGSAGRSSLVYSPPPYDIHLEKRLHLEAGPHSAKQILELRKLHLPEVMDPILGWVAAAPLRSHLPSFPTLAVTGASGSGKTTLVSTVLSTFTGADISTNLTSTTRHALAAFIASTNAFPVWFDEYRPGARKDTQLVLEQLIRDAYTGQISAKGGLGERWSEVSAMPTDAPIVVTGEDTFTETSHTERMINLPLPSRGKNPKALKEVNSWGPTGLPLAYLEWLASEMAQDGINFVPAPCGSEEGLPPRQRDNLGTVQWGWDLLRRFCLVQGVVLPREPDLSLVEDTAKEVATHNPIADAIRWTIDEPDAAFFARYDPEQNEVYIRPVNFVSFIERGRMFKLPGKTQAIERYLLDLEGAYKDKRAFGGKDLSCIVIPFDVIR